MNSCPVQLTDPISQLSHERLTSTHLEAEHFDRTLPIADDRLEVVIEPNTLVPQGEAKRTSGKADDVEVGAETWIFGVQRKFEAKEFDFAENSDIEGAIDFDVVALLCDR